MYRTVGDRESLGRTLRWPRPVAAIGDALVHADHGKTAANHCVGAPANAPALRVLAGGVDA